MNENKLYEMIFAKVKDYSLEKSLGQYWDLVDSLDKKGAQKLQRINSLQNDMEQ